jgi:hypothetical protein
VLDWRAGRALGSVVEFLLGGKMTLKIFSHSGQGSGGAGTLPREIGETFEETYPRYTFSILVGLSIGLGRWLGGVLREYADRPAVPHRGDAPLGPRNLAGPIARPGS